MPIPTQLLSCNLPQLEDPLKIPSTKELKAMRLYASQVVARMIERKGIAKPVNPNELATPKESDKPCTKKWHDYWQFPGGLGLNIPNNVKKRSTLKRLIPEVLKRQIEYLESQGFNADKQRLYLEAQGTSPSKEACPFLALRKIPKNSAEGGRDICLSCPLWDEDTQSGSCVYEKYAKITK